LAKASLFRQRFLTRLFTKVLTTFFIWVSLVFSISVGAREQKGGASGLSVQKIEITGQRKIETDAILARIKSRVGAPVDTSWIREDIQQIFKTGFFYDVQVSQVPEGSGLKLVYSLVEKPSVNEILVEGNSELKSEEILEAAALKPFEIISMTRIREAVEKIQKLYEDKGFFLAKISTRFEDLKAEESVRLIINVEENEKVRVKKITFLGNSKLKEGYLKGRIKTQEAGYFSFFSGSGAYKQEDFDRDVQILRFLYFNEGFVQVKIDRPSVYVTPDKKSIYITVRIDEGERYDVGEVDFSGDLLFGRDELRSAIKIHSLKVYNHETLLKDIQELQAKYGDLGYAFANVIPRTRINDQERKVDITFEFDKGVKVYFGKINVVGNAKTRDKVVRRELKIREGELYNESRRRESLENVQRLGFFDEVNFRTSTPPEKPDQLNVDIAVKERNTGTIQLGAGYGSATGFSLNGSLNQTNFLGKGQKFGASLQVSGDRSEYSVNFTEPYFLDTDWSVGFDVYQSQSARTYYTEKGLGAAVRLGHPLGEYISGTVRYKYDRTLLSPVYEDRLDTNQQRFSYLVTDYALFPLDTASGDTSSLTGIVEYDKRNDRFSPSKGTYLAASFEYAGIGGSIRYSKGNGTARYFNKLFWEFVWRNNLSYTFITPHDGATPPFTEVNRLLLGGPYSLRGYRMFRVGRTIFSERTQADLLARGRSPADAQRLANLPYGGTQQLLYQMEFEFPLIAEAGIKAVAFYDIGQSEDRITSEGFYSDVGFGFRWFSPIGPLRFEWGFPLRSNENSPDPVVFEFSIGTPF
jgi:outer membrane protein insertion porin family